VSRPPRREPSLPAAPAPSPALPFITTRHGLSLAVKVTPKAAADRIDGPFVDADGRVRLKLSVAAPPDGGRANAAVIALLARTLDLPASAFTLARGTTNRRKTLTIGGDGADIASRLGARLTTTAAVDAKATSRG
jgi:uncharacterized protein YggU (UPF0235/DUF167 family)